MTTEIGLARKSIIMGKTEKAFSILFDCVHHLKGTAAKKIHNELCVYSHNFSQLEKNKRLGILTDENFTQNSNQITSSLIETISELEAYIESEGIAIRKINLNNSFSIPRHFISNNFYYGFLITGLTLGVICGVIFMALYHKYLMQEQQELKELLFIGSIGATASLFLCGTFDGLNKQKKKLVDLRIIVPHLILIILLLIISGGLSLGWWSL